MSLDSLNKQEKKVLKEILSPSKYYMRPIIRKINQWVASQQNIKNAWVLVLNQLHDIIRNSQSGVEKLLEGRIQQKKIKSKSQAMKSIVGNAFSNSLIYVFLLNKVHGNVPRWIFITSQISSIPNFKKSININIQNEVQKPDMDIVIYTLNDGFKQKREPENYIILSLKTSLRERAAQTYKWKLLMEIALHSPELREKYSIFYQSSAVPIVCFATTNFYNEINNPQQRGMLKFFDRSFIAKEIAFTQNSLIYPLSNLISFAIEKLSNPYVQLSLF
ncbi:MAG: BsaWI family type II restriction enzyme [Acinetobacter sp.]